jgi:hypothetical protein
MMHSQAKRYELTLWETEHRSGAAVKLSFDDVVERLAEMENQRKVGRYRSGLLTEHHKVSQEWLLVRQYP